MKDSHIPMSTHLCFPLMVVAALIFAPFNQNAIAQSMGNFFEFQQPDPTAPEGVVLGDFSKTFGTASMKTDPFGKGLHVKLNTDVIPGAYSVWGAVFNNPAACPDGCDGSDLLLPAVQGSVIWAGGVVVEPNPLDPDPSNPTMPNTLGFERLIELNRPPGEVRIAGEVGHGPAGLDPNGLTNLGAEFHPVLRYHGPASADPVELKTQTDSYAGGCQIISAGSVVQEGPFLCYDNQAAILKPVSQPTFKQVVSPAEFEFMDADTSSIAWGDGIRWQRVDSSEIFEDTIPDGAFISGISWRPNHHVPVGSEVLIDRLVVSLATTDKNPGDISEVFAENITSPQTVVHDGTWSAVVETENPAEGTRPFEYRIPFSTPFYYDPSAGNLLVDFVADGPSSSLEFNALALDVTLSDLSTTRSIWTSPNFPIDSEFAAPGVRFSEVTEFTFLVAAAGDFNANGELDAADIDLLSDAVAGQTNHRRFDLNEDNLVDEEDRQVWIKDLRETWAGDANLDGEFDSGDMIEVFQAGEYEDAIAGNSTWATGDWNGDKEFDSGDLISAFKDGGFEAGRRMAVTKVPEPSSSILFICCAFLASRRFITR